MSNMTARAYDDLRSMLAEVYTPEGVAIWLRAPNQNFGGLTVDEMIAAGRSPEVLAAAERLVTGAM